ncbi:MAG: hypothetical protein E6Q90_05795 [Actinobacteria bacterium]|nr:MAG: hypothetical protein E6Q90_05795 [Actinomycetota bacterium]
MSAGKGVAAESRRAPTTPRPRSRPSSLQRREVRREARLVIACLAAVVVLLVGAAAWALRDGWTPVSDAALLQLRLDRMLVDPPQVGVYSRFGWFHPGPAYLWFMWLPYELLGAAGLVLAIVVLHVGALVLGWLCARKLSVTAGGFAVLAALVVIWARPADQALLPWNPYVSMVGGVTLVLAAWSAAERRRLGAALLLPLGTFLVQAHVGTAPLVLLVVLTALVLMLLPRSEPQRKPWLWWCFGAASAALMWIPPMIDQLAGSHNLSAILQAVFGDGNGDPIGWGSALGALSQAYSRHPYWLSFAGDVPTGLTIPWLLVLPAVALAVALLARRRSGGLHLRLLAVLAAANFAIPVAISGVRGPVYDYLVAWIPAVAVLTCALSVWVLLDCIPGLASAPAPATIGALRLSAALGVAAVPIAGAIAWGWLQAPLPFAHEGAAAQHLADALGVDSTGQRVALVRPSGASATDQLVGVEQGVLAQATAAGVDVVPDALTAGWIGAAPAADLSSRIRYTVVPWTPYYDPPEGQDLADIYDPFSPEQWQRIEDLNRQLAAAGGDQKQKYLLALELNKVTGGEQAYGLIRLDPMRPPEGAAN